MRSRVIELPEPAPNRDALTTGDIGPADLVELPHRDEHRRRPTQWAAAVAVVVAAAAVGLVASRGSASQRTPGGDALAGVTGYRRRVTASSVDKGKLSVPAQLGASVGSSGPRRHHRRYGQQSSRSLPNDEQRLSDN